MNTETVVQQAAQRKRQDAFPRGRWTLNPFKSEKPAPRPIIQGELSLDKVKPLRNDLSDSDLELVAAAKPQPPLKVVQSESEGLVAKAAEPMLTRVLALFQRRN